VNLRLPIALIALLAVTACDPPPVDSPAVRPDGIVNFDYLYARNCAGCHGVDGKGGAAIGLGDPVYLAIADDATILRVTADGVPGTAMPAFAQRSGGMLTDEQVKTIVTGIRTRWSKPNILEGANAPPYSASSPGDPGRGAAVYVSYCSSCHGAGGRGTKRASSIVDGSFLGLVSNQGLRTTVIVGRPELGAPDWRGDVPGKTLPGKTMPGKTMSGKTMSGKTMSAQDVSDVVAWLAAQRPQFPGQPYSIEAQMKGRP
jgi:cytochrome c oxidase cbb3-type subunit III